MTQWLQISRSIAMIDCRLRCIYGKVCVYISGVWGVRQVMLCYGIPLGCIVLYYSCGSVVHDCSSTVKMLHSVRRDSIRPIHGPWGPSATLQPLLFLETSVGRPRISLPSGI
jgi:hypothetical protein